MDKKDELELVISANNCLPQIMVKTANGSREQNVVNEQDAEESLATEKAVIKNNSLLKENATNPTNSKRKSFQDSTKVILNESLTFQPKRLGYAANNDQLYEFIDYLVALSPLKTTHWNDMEYRTTNQSNRS